MGLTNPRQRRITHKAAVGAAEWRIGHHRHGMPLAPGQQATLNATIPDVVRDLIGRAAIAARNTEQLFQITDAKVGHAPGFNFARRPEGLEGRHNVGKMGGRFSPMQ